MKNKSTLEALQNDLDIIGIKISVEAAYIYVALNEAIKNKNLNALAMLMQNPLVHDNLQNSEMLKEVNEKALINFVEENNTDAVKILIEGRVNTNLRNADGNSLSHIAIMKGYKDILELLLRNNVDTEAKTSYGFTAIQLATLYDNSEAFKLLVQYNANTSIKDSDGSTLLELAANRESFNTAKLILEANIEISEEEANNALLEAICIKSKEMIKLFLEHNVKFKDSEGDDALSIAVDHKDIEMARMVLERKEKLNEEKSSHTLYWAVQQADTDMVKLLLKHGIKLNDKDSGEALYDAVRYNYIEMALLLLESGVDANKGMLGVDTTKRPSIRVEIPSLRKAIENNNEEMVKLLFKYNANILIIGLDKIKLSRDSSLQQNIAQIYKALNGYDVDLAQLEDKELVLLALKAQLVSQNAPFYIDRIIKHIKEIDNTANIKDLILQANNGDVVQSAKVIKASIEAQKAFDNNTSSLAYDVENQLKKSGVPEEFTSLKECLNLLKISTSGGEESFIEKYCRSFIEEINQLYSYVSSGNETLMKAFSPKRAFEKALNEIAQGNNVNLESLRDEPIKEYYDLMLKYVAKAEEEYLIVKKFDRFNAALDEISANDVQNSLAALAFKGALNKIVQDNIIDIESLFKGSEGEIILRKAETLSTFIENSNVILTSNEIEARDTLHHALKEVLGEVSHQE